MINFLISALFWPNSSMSVVVFITLPWEFSLFTLSLRELELITREVPCLSTTVNDSYLLETMTRRGMWCWNPSSSVETNYYHTAVSCQAEKVIWLLYFRDLDGNQSRTDKESLGFSKFIKVIVLSLLFVLKSSGVSAIGRTCIVFQPFLYFASCVYKHMSCYFINTSFHTSGQCIVYIVPLIIGEPLRRGHLLSRSDLITNYLYLPHVWSRLTSDY